MILIPKMPNGESRGNELGDDQQEQETNMGDLSGGEQMGSRDTVRSRTPFSATGHHVFHTQEDQWPFGG